MARILLTGGSGLLGRELQKYIDCEAPSHREFDITRPIERDSYDMVIHSAAYTDVAKAEIDKKNCFLTNVIGTMGLAMTYYDIPFVYISSEYAHKPVNYYSETKRAGEMAVEAYCRKYLIIRTLFKPNPFPHGKAFFDQYTQGDSVDVIAPLIVDLIKNDSFDGSIKYVGTGRKTMLQLAMKTKPLVIASSVREVKGVTLPTDYV